MRDDGLGGGGAVDILANDVVDARLGPAEDFGDHALVQTGDIELGRGGAAQIVKVQNADSGGGLGAAETSC